MGSPELHSDPSGIASRTIPVVLSIGGHDPSGGAGVQADIETIISLGCHAATVLTCLTVQDTRDVQRSSPVEPHLVIEQARALLEDMPVAAVKLGLLGNELIIQALHSVLRDYPTIPVVLDTVLASGGGTELSNAEMRAAMMTLMVPHATVLTPNGVEARRLAPEADTLDACAMCLLERGCEYVLITGGHENSADVVNRLYGNHRLLDQYRFRRLRGDFHGSGCTLASAIAALLAQGNEPRTAIHQAQDFTWSALEQGYRIGMGQQIPNRLFWGRKIRLG